jgi:Protein of unknown function (Hypoth_ymh).
MARAKLDHKLLEKFATKTGRKKPVLQSSISQFASKHAISSEAALVLLTKQQGIGSAHYLKNLSPDIQAQVRDTLPAMLDKPAPRRDLNNSGRAKPTKESNRQRTNVALATEYLIHDLDLRARVMDLLKARGKFDRVIREATTVLDHRIKSLSGLNGKPLQVITKAINQEPSRAVLEFSNEPSQQEGFFNIYKGIFLAFRNVTHHELTDKFTREDALKFCGFVDLLLLALSQAVVHVDRI